jgi:hypothetical protein
MARKRTKTKATKKVVRRARRGTVKAPGKTRKPVARKSAAKAAESSSVGAKAMDILRAWAPSRYSKR